MLKKFKKILQKSSNQSAQSSISNLPQQEQVTLSLKQFSQTTIPGISPITIEPINKSVTNFTENFAFTVLPAVGGLVIQIKDFNITTNKVMEKLYIIPEGDNVSKQIGDIVCMEMLRRV